MKKPEDEQLLLELLGHDHIDTVTIYLSGGRLLSGRVDKESLTPTSLTLTMHNGRYISVIRTSEIIGFTYDG